ncbi:MAG: transposase [Nitrospirota bacterium]
MGTSKGGLTTDARGNPVRVILSGGQGSDYTQALPLIDGVQAQAMPADKGYDSDEIVDGIVTAGAQAVIPPRSNRKNPRGCDFAFYAERHRIECFFSQLKHDRGIATHYCKRNRIFQFLICLATPVIWMR